STSDNRIVLRDSRDNKEYNIAKLADGTCWMTENLALNGTDESGNPRTLTTADTNISTSEISSGSYTFPSGVDISVGTSSAYSPAQIVTRDQDKTDNGNKYGNYYNYLAATVGVGTQSKTSGDIASSVCPKGWRLPAYSGSGSFQALGSVYSLSSSNVWNTIRTAPLYFPAAGLYNSGVSDQGSYGYYWSRRVIGTSNAYNLIFSSSYYVPQYGSSGNKSHGFSVRCVFDPAVGNMQDFTSSMCSSLSTSTATSDNRILLKDTRDNKVYNVAKLADGNCWMVQNLALDGTDSNGNVRTLTSADSDVTANRTLAVNISDGTTSNKTSVQIISDWAENSGCLGTTNCVSGNTEKYGNFYNWYAATATTGTSSLRDADASDSVCPKGWKLPTSAAYNTASSSAPDKSYGKLMYSVLNYSGSGGWSSSNVQMMQQAPLWFSFPGFYDSGLDNQGDYGYYWSRNYALYLFFSTDGRLYPQSNYNNNGLKYRGFSVRCVFNG
ncbi:hypothetical protein IJ096_02075, partial [Candidatus Saccharibacteria bacterium]|nr:hypothetical protein [Candidatus Saccharibacteria bacterium]